MIATAARPAGISGAWVVRGRRTRADGTEQLYLSCAWGRTEDLARLSHATIGQAGVRQGSYAPDDLWAPEELEFTPVEQDHLHAATMAIAR